MSQDSMRIDELTGLLARPALIEKMEEAARKEESLVAIFLDLDHFMHINETYGHQTGDEWLKAIAARFSEVFGKDGMVARWGGDEFVAAVTSKNLEEVYEMAEALRSSVEKDCPTTLHNGQPIQTGGTISLGLAAFPANARDPMDLVEKSKQALYTAKEKGGNRVRFYQEADTLTGLLNSFSTQRALEEALAEAQEKDGTLSVFLLDIDRFKDINDDYGRRAGDEVLKRLARILQSNFDSLGVVGRIKADEFIVILPDQRADSAFVLADEVRRLVEDSEVQITIGNHTNALHFHISGGIANYPADAAEHVDLLRKADEALYRSKKTGRNRISLPASAQMVTKTSHYTQVQLERLAALARKQDKTEAFLLREALDDLLRKYKESGV